MSPLPAALAFASAVFLAGLAPAARQASAGPPGGRAHIIVAQDGTAPASRPLTWSRVLEQPPAWYGSAEALRIAEQVLMYQRRTGGWPKNVDMARALTGVERVEVERAKEETDSTIDNGATTTQLRFQEIGTNRPIFSGRDGTVRDAMAAIEHERRVNYAWYGHWPEALLARDYPEWKKRH